MGEGASVAGRLGRAGEALNAAARAGRFGKVGTGAVGAIERAGAATRTVTQTIKTGTQAAKARALEHLGNLVPRPRLAVPGGHLELPNIHMMSAHSPGGVGGVGGAGAAAIQKVQTQLTGLQGTLNRMLPANAVTGDAAKVRVAAEKIMADAEKRAAKAATAKEAEKITEQARREVARKMQSIDTRKGPLVTSPDEQMFRTRQQAEAAARTRGAGIPKDAKLVDQFEKGPKAVKASRASAAAGEGKGAKYVLSNDPGGHGHYKIYEVAGPDGNPIYRTVVNHTGDTNNFLPHVHAGEYPPVPVGPEIRGSVPGKSTLPDFRHESYDPIDASHHYTY